VPASAIAEYHQKSGKKFTTAGSSDSESNTSSNSSIGATKADEDPPTSDRYVTVCATPITESQEPTVVGGEQERVCFVLLLSITEYPDTKPVYVNITIPPQVDLARRPQEDSHDYENILPRPLTEQKQ